MEKTREFPWGTEEGFKSVEMNKPGILFKLLCKYCTHPAGGVKSEWQKKKKKKR